MVWKKPSEELSRFLEESISSFGVKKKKMFGCPVYFTNDNMVAGVFENDIFMRLSEKDRKEMYKCLFYDYLQRYGIYKTIKYII